jgi:hypothetical protein
MAGRCYRTDHRLPVWLELQARPEPGRLQAVQQELLAPQEQLALARFRTSHHPE